MDGAVKDGAIMDGAVKDGVITDGVTTGVGNIDATGTTEPVRHEPGALPSLRGKGFYWAQRPAQIFALPPRPPRENAAPLKSLFCGLPRNSLGVDPFAT
jgi:hypothetical protein